MSECGCWSISHSHDVIQLCSTCTKYIALGGAVGYVQMTKTSVCPPEGHSLELCAHIPRFSLKSKTKQRRHKAGAKFHLTERAGEKAPHPIKGFHGTLVLMLPCLQGGKDFIFGELRQRSEQSFHLAQLGRCPALLIWTLTCDLIGRVPGNCSLTQQTSEDPTVWLGSQGAGLAFLSCQEE